MERDGRRRRKKLIWAVEAVSGDSRISCGECNESLRRKQGCKKAGLEPTDGATVYHSDSPSLVDGPHWRLYECPVSMLLREAPWVWDVLSAERCCESAGLEVLRQSRFFRDAVRLVASERGRHTENRHEQRKRRSDAEHGARLLRRG